MLCISGLVMNKPLTPTQWVGQCHCGNVRLTLSELTPTATECNCSLCSRYGAWWGYFTPQQVTIEVGTAGLNAYRHGDEMIDFQHCGQCGCITHYTSTDKAPSERVAVNYRMFESDVTLSLKLRHFDGADTWTYLD